MPQIDPKYVFWFGVWTNVLMLIATLGVDSAPPLVAQYAPTVQWVCAFFYKVNSVLLTAASGLSSNKPGPLVSVPVKAVIIVAFVIGALLMPNGAHAQGVTLPKIRPPQITGDVVGDTKANLGIGGASSVGSKLTGSAITDLQSALNAKLLPDLQYALKLAQASNNTVTSDCFSAWIDIITSQQNAVKNPDGTDLAMPDPHLIADFEKLVELRNALQPESKFNVKCSPVASMLKRDLASFMGVVISGGAGLATLVPGL